MILGLSRMCLGHEHSLTSWCLYPKVVPRQPHPGPGRAHADEGVTGRSLPSAQEERAQLLCDLVPVSSRAGKWACASVRSWMHPSVCLMGKVLFMPWPSALRTDAAMRGLCCFGFGLGISTATHRLLSQAPSLFLCVAPSLRPSLGVSPGVGEILARSCLAHYKPL